LNRLPDSADFQKQENRQMQTAETAEQESGFNVLTQSQVASFWENGYLVVGKVLEDDLIEEMRAEYDDEFALGRSGDRPVRNLAVFEDDHDHDEEGEQEMLQFMQISEHNV